MTNYYETLGISKDADEVEMKKAYRSLSLKYHPDRNPDEDTKQKFQEINEAYETLSDPNKRQMYDMGQNNVHHHDPFNNMHQEFQDINNIFNNIFGGGRFQQHFSFGGGGNFRVFHSGPGGFHAEFSTSFQQSPPPPLLKDVELTLEQVYHGCSIPLEINRWVVKNNEKISESETIMVSIPQGVDQNEYLIIKEKGNALAENLKGDLKISFNIINNTPFERRNLDLFFRKTITLKEALCGFVIDIPHISGKLFSLNNNTNSTIIKPGFVKSIQNLGMIKDSKSGDLIIQLDIEFPNELNETQKTELSRILS